MWKTFKKNRLSIFGTFIFGLVIVAAIVGPWVYPGYFPFKTDISGSLGNLSLDHPLGQDYFGRDVLSRMFLGTRISLFVGISSVFIGLLIGSLFGVFAGYKGGSVDKVITMIIDALMSIPTLVVGLLFAAALGAGLLNVILAIGIAVSPRFARIARGITKSVKVNTYIEATIALGATTYRVIKSHLFPNIIGELVVVATLWTGTAIIIESSLSFIGLSVSPPIPTLGGMIEEGLESLSNAPWISMFPGFAIFIAVLSINMVGDGFRDIIDPKTR